VSCSFSGINNQPGMPLEHFRHPPFRRPSPDQFQRRQNKECFGCGQKNCADDVAWPMRAQINSRITDERRENPVKPPPPVKQSQTNRGDGVVGHVTRWKRWIAAPAIRFVGTAHHRFFEDRHKLRPPFFQSHHPDRSHVLGTFAMMTQSNKQKMQARALNPPKTSAAKMMMMSSGFQTSASLTAAMNKSRAG